MRILIVGGSAHSTPQLFASLPPRGGGSFDVTLAGRSAQRLVAVGHAIEAVSPLPCSIRTTSLAPHDVREAAGRADVVLIQARVGGYAARAHDESFPLAAGLCGDEGLGPGGLAAGWRTWPFLRDMLQAIHDAGTTPRILLMTSPVSLLTSCAKAAFPSADVYGICELPWVTLRDVVRRTGADPKRVAFEYAGVNHLGWFTKIADGSRDLVAAFRETLAPGTFPSAASIDESGAIPLKYLRLHYEADAVLREQRSKPPRALELDALQAAAFSAFATRDAATIAAALARRPAPWYADAIAHLIAPNPEDDPSPVLFLTTTNAGYVPWLDDAAVVEIPHVTTATGLRRHAPVLSAGEHVRRQLAAFVSYEAAATRAVVNRDEEGVARALAMHPWVRDESLARRLAPQVTRDLNGREQARVIREDVAQTLA